MIPVPHYLTGPNTVGPFKVAPEANAHGEYTVTGPGFTWDGLETERAAVHCAEALNVVFAMGRDEGKRDIHDEILREWLTLKNRQYLFEARPPKVHTFGGGV